ncbi:MAG TPA: glycosyl hydrolase family 65 protein, partial [Solirubrobacteraceae bacterium]|nr:glycosyl hydrolase family 65 protein [Solirubrobacteraceae bacterium]
GRLSFKPQLPEEITRLAFRLTFRGSTFAVEIEHSQATYRLLAGEPIEVAHYDSSVQLTEDGPVSLPIPAMTWREPPTQPVGREPRHRG